MSWENIKVCRICSSPADYDVFSRIPSYLHANSNEFANWQKCINILIEETTGIQVSKDDGLPSTICAICISYLKHAVMFREQTINNALSLKAVQLLKQQSNQAIITQLENDSNPNDKVFAETNIEHLNFNSETRIKTNLLLNNTQISNEPNKVNKQLLNYISNPLISNSTSSGISNVTTNIEQQIRYLNMLFDKDPNSGIQPKQRNSNTKSKNSKNTYDYYYDEEFQTTTSSDENETGAATNFQPKNIFSYREKNFEEDDIMDMDELKNVITINIPETCKERKCRACFRRCMFDETFREHLENCIEYMFLTLIEEINRLLEIRRAKAISPHEYIRRMIFCLRKTCEWLQANCEDMFLPDLLQNGKEIASSAESSNKMKTVSSSERNHKINEVSAGNLDLSNVEKIDEHKSQQYVRQKRSSSATSITFDNNILYEIERSQSRSSNKSVQIDSTPANFNSILIETANSQLKKPIFEKGNIKTTPKPPNSIMRSSSQSEVERLTFLQKLHDAQTPPPLTKSVYNSKATPITTVRKDLVAQTNTKMSPITTNNSIFSARCNPCNLMFETLVSLEIHNAIDHNNIIQAAGLKNEREEERKKIIALFEDDEN